MKSTLLSPVRRVTRKLAGDFKHSRAVKQSGDVDISSVKSVCLALGPYRNLTTLTASVIGLHPNCQVLNHGGGRVFSANRLNFIKDYETTKFEAFTKYAIYASGRGQRGVEGGSIVYSHAFKDQMKNVYEDRYGGDLTKSEIECVFWKESLYTSIELRENAFDFDKAFSLNDKLRFLMPIRNPLDCATSNISTKMYKIFPNLDYGASFEEVLEAVLDEFNYFFTLAEKYPDRFYCFFEHEFSGETLNELARFLGVEVDKRWYADAMGVFSNNSSYDYPREQLEYYERLLKEKFSDFPNHAERLFAFTKSTVC